MATVPKAVVPSKNVTDPDRQLAGEPEAVTKEVKSTAFPTIEGFEFEASVVVEVVS